MNSLIPKHLHSNCQTLEHFNTNSRRLTVSIKVEKPWLMNIYFLNQVYKMDTTTKTLAEELKEIEQRLKTICLTKPKTEPKRKRSPEYIEKQRIVNRQYYQQHREEILRSRKEQYQNMTPDEKKELLNKCKAKRLSKMMLATKKDTLHQNL